MNHNICIIIVFYSNACKPTNLIRYIVSLMKNGTRYNISVGDILAMFVPLRHS